MGRKESDTTQQLSPSQIGYTEVLTFSTVECDTDPCSQPQKELNPLTLWS